jgi:hypothetical protein
VVQRWRDRAQAVVAQLGSVRLTPVTPGRVRWLAARLVGRCDDVTFDADWEPRDGRTASLFGPYREVRFVEGGDKRDAGRGVVGRYVRVEAAGSTSYHACLVMSEMPSTWTFPAAGGVLAGLESAAEAATDGEVIEADVCVRIRRISNTDAVKQVRRKRSKLAWQRGEYAGNVTGVPGSVGSSLAALSELEAALEANRAEPELQCTTIVHLADRSLERLERHATALQAQLEPANYGLVRPLGEQLRLLAMMLPGSPTTAPAADFRQHLLARDLASCLPLCGGGVGDDRGGLFGSLLDSGLSDPVLLDPSRGPRENRSGNLAGVGGLGGGKSVAAKRLIETVIADGGQVITIDRGHEYVRFAEALAKLGVSTQVIRLGVDTGVCLDPLRVFRDTERVSVTVGFLAQLCAADAGSLEATTLAEAVETVAARRDARLVDVIDELNHRGQQDAPEAVVLARKLGRYARMDRVGQVTFGDGDPLDLTASFVVISAAGLDLVPREVLENEHLSRRMLDSQVAAQALLFLTAAVARRSTFADPSRFAVALLDEWWGLKGSPHGEALVNDWLRTSRKYNAAVWLFSQDAGDIDAEVRGFLGLRLVFRQNSSSAARAALELLELDATDDLVRRLCSQNPTDGGFASGMCLFSDVTGRIGHVQVHQALHPVLREAADTRPPAPATVPGRPMRLVR